MVSCLPIRRHAHRHDPPREARQPTNGRLYPGCVHGARMDTAHDPPGERSRGVRNNLAEDPFGRTNHPRSMGVELTVGQLLSDPAPCTSAGSAARCAAADQRSALPGCVHGARMDTAHDPPAERSRGVRNNVAHDPFGWTNHPQSMGVELTVGQLLSDPAPCTSARPAARCTAADQRSALPGMCPRGEDAHRPRSTGRAEPWGSQQPRRRSIRTDESPADHGGRADRWSAAFRSGVMHIGRIRRAMRGSRPTVGSTRDVSTGREWTPPTIHRASGAVGFATTSPKIHSDGRITRGPWG